MSTARASSSRVHHSRDGVQRDANLDTRHRRSRSPDRPRQTDERRRSPDRRRMDEERSRRRSYSSDEEDDRKRKHSSRDETKEERRARREAKRERKAKERREKRLGDDYGKYGILTETDIYTKGAEFQFVRPTSSLTRRTWLIEERKINPEALPQHKLKDLFKSFMEDYNLAVLPHVKFYDLERAPAVETALTHAGYTRELDATRPLDGSAQESRYDPTADEQIIQAAHRVKRATAELSRKEVLELRQIERERAQATNMRRLGQEVPSHYGVRYKLVQVPQDEDHNGF